MTKDELKAWADDPRRQDTLPFGLYEPLEQKAIAGAALVVRGVLYFKGGHTETVRQALVQSYERYMAVIGEYQKALADAAGAELPRTGPMRWFYAEGKKPIAFEQTRGFPVLAKQVPSNAMLVSTTTSTEHKFATGFFDFSVFCFEDWQAGRALDALTFSVPRRFLQTCPGAFETLFAEFVAALPIVWGHAGYAVNLPPARSRGKRGERVFLVAPVRPRYRCWRSDAV